MLLLLFRWLFISITVILISSLTTSCEQKQQRLEKNAWWPHFRHQTTCTQIGSYVCTHTHTHVYTHPVDQTCPILQASCRHLGRWSPPSQHISWHWRPVCTQPPTRNRYHHHRTIITQSYSPSSALSKHRHTQHLTTMTTRNRSSPHLEVCHLPSFV